MTFLIFLVVTRNNSKAGLCQLDQYIFVDGFSDNDGYSGPFTTHCRVSVALCAVLILCPKLAWESQVSSAFGVLVFHFKSQSADFLIIKGLITNAGFALWRSPN